VTKLAPLREVSVYATVHVHPVRGELHIQHNANVEAGTTSPPFYNELHRSHVLFVKAAPGHSTIFVSKGAKLHTGSKQQ